MCYQWEQRFRAQKLSDCRQQSDQWEKRPPHHMSVKHRTIRTTRTIRTIRTRGPCWNTSCRWLSAALNRSPVSLLRPGLRNVALPQRLSEPNHRLKQKWCEHHGEEPPWLGPAALMKTFICRADGLAHLQRERRILTSGGDITSCSKVKLYIKWRAEEKL